MMSKDDLSQPQRMMIPDNIQFSMQGFAEDEATSIANTVGGVLRSVSRYIDLTTLDGVTIAYDYDEALVNLDRGYETSFRLTKTTEYGEGVAMSPAVIRDGKIKTHIVLSATVALPLMSPDDEFFGQCIYTIAHECAHVDVTAAFDQAFPKRLLQPRDIGLHEFIREDVTKACWDEFAACWISFGIGKDTTAYKEDVFFAALADPLEKVKIVFRDFQQHRDRERTTRETYGVLGTLMKFACYLIGNMHAQDFNVDALPRTSSALEGHWFRPFFERLQLACAAIAESYGAWQSYAPFEAIGDIADDLVSYSGLQVTPMRDGSMFVRVPIVF